MDLRHLKVFVEVVHSGNFTRAAEHLHIAQPAVSITIQKIEEELDLVLLNRQGKQVTLTAEGEALLHHAEKILEMAKIMEQEMAERKDLTQGEVRVAIPPMMSAYYFPAIINAFLKRYPKLRLQVSGEGTDRIQQMIINGEIDMGVIARPERTEGIAYKHFLREEIVACVPHDHQLAKKKTIDIEDFLKEPQILFKEGYYTRELIKELMVKTRVEPHIVFETNLYTLVSSMIRQGLGVSTLLHMVVSQDDELQFLSFTEPLYIDLYIAWKSQRHLSRANRAFIDFLMNEAGDLPSVRILK